MPELKFVTVAGPTQAKTAASRSIIRSHVARYQWHQHLAERKAKHIYKTRVRPLQLRFIVHTKSIDDADAALVETSDPNPVARVEPLIGGTRVDPFACFPAQWQSFFPAVIDHYLVHMAVDIPELDQPGNHGLLRTSWFPLVISEASTFLVVLLLAASHFSSVSTATVGPVNLLKLKQQALEAINESLQSPKGSMDDPIIGAVAKMASYEAMYGDVTTYQAHMRGLKKMIEMRGGLSSLGLNGLLRRMIIWIDTNSSFLNNTPLYFPGEQFAADDHKMEPNPGHFIGNCG